MFKIVRSMSRDPRDEEMFQRFTKVTQKVKRSMRYRGSYATGDILSALVTRWLESGEWERLKVLPPAQQQIGVSVRRFILDRIGTDKVLAAARKQIAEQQRRHHAHVLQIITEDELRTAARPARALVLVVDAEPAPRLDLRSAKVMLHRVAPQARTELAQLVQQRGGAVVMPSKQVPLAAILETLTYLIVGNIEQTELTSLPDESALAAMIEDQEVLAWVRDCIKRLMKGQVDPRVKVPPQLVRNNPVEVGTVLSLVMEGYNVREIGLRLGISSTAAHDRKAAGEKYLSMLRIIEECQP
jgi:hypothetical protein